MTPQQAVSPQTVADLRSLVRRYEQSLSDEADAEMNAEIERLGVTRGRRGVADAEIERALAGVGDALRAYEEAGKRASSSS